MRKRKHTRSLPTLGGRELSAVGPADKHPSPPPLPRVVLNNIVCIADKEERQLNNKLCDISAKSTLTNTNEMNENISRNSLVSVSSERSRLNFVLSFVFLDFYSPRFCPWIWSNYKLRIVFNEFDVPSELKIPYFTTRNTRILEILSL